MAVTVLASELCRRNLLLSWRQQQIHIWYAQRILSTTEEKNWLRAVFVWYVDYFINAGLIKVNTFERIQTKTNGSKNGPFYRNWSEKEHAKLFIDFPCKCLRNVRTHKLCSTEKRTRKTDKASTLYNDHWSTSDKCVFFCWHRNV